MYALRGPCDLACWKANWFWLKAVLSFCACNALASLAPPNALPATLPKNLPTAAPAGPKAEPIDSPTALPT